MAEPRHTNAEQEQSVRRRAEEQEWDRRLHRAAAKAAMAREVLERARADAAVERLMIEDARRAATDMGDDGC